MSESGASFDQLLGLTPELLRDYTAFESRLWSSGVEPALLELCRVRVALVLGCAGECERRTADVALDDGKLAALEAWESSDVFNSLQRAALRLTDGFVLKPHGVTDADAAALAAHLTPPQMIALIEALALFDGFTRFRMMLGTVEEA